MLSLYLPLDDAPAVDRGFIARAKAFAYLQADLRLYSALGRAAQGLSLIHI